MTSEVSASRVSVVLGAIGLLAAGPLVATLLIGRTGVLPSVRWLGLALASWVTLGALGWATAGGRRGSALAALAPLVSLAVFLPWAYADDQAFHILVTSRTLVLICLGGLALIGLGWRAMGPSKRLAGEAPRRSEPLSPALVAPIAGMALMYGLNDVFFEPLGRAGSMGPLLALAPLVPAALVLAAMHWRLVHPLTVVALAAGAWFAAALSVWMGLAPPGPWSFVIALIALTPVATDAFWRTVPRALHLAHGGDGRDA